MGLIAASAFTTPRPLIELVAFLLPLLPAVYVDVRSRRIPDLLLLASAVLLLAVRVARQSLLIAHVVGALFAFAVLLVLRLAMRSKVGWGDVKLSALVGFLLGPWSWALAAFAASASGIVFLCARQASGRGTLRQSVAFAPFLAGGAVASFFLSPVVSGLLGVR